MPPATVIVVADDLVLVTGGTGKTGRRVAAQLRERGADVRVGSRRSAVPFDWHDPGTWAAALDGVGLVYLAPAEGSLATAAFARAAAEAGVSRIVQLSARGVTTEGYYDDQGVLAPQHVDGERGVRASGAAWAIVRPGWFAQNFSEGDFLRPVLAGRLRLPAGDGAAAFVDADDIAAVVVALLLDGGHDGEELELTGPGAVTVAQAVGLIAAVSGREVRYEPITPQQYRQQLLAEGASEHDAAVAVAAMSPIRSGREGATTDAVRRVLGREARSFEQFVHAAADAWR